MYKLKVIPIGSFLGVVLPQAVLDKLRVKKGDVVYLTEAPDGFRVTPISAEFAEQMEAAEEVTREDRDILRALAK
jgi:putative addiction module antidote